MKRFRPIQSERGGILIKMIVLLFLMTCFLALYFVRHPIFRFMAESWVVEDLLDKAEALAKLAKTKKWHSAIIVTSNYHTRRARYIFRHVFPQGMETRVASARDGDFDPQNWWEKRKSAKVFMREIVGMAETIWEFRYGAE